MGYCEACESSESSVLASWERRFTFVRREGERGEGVGSHSDAGGSVKSVGDAAEARDRVRLRWVVGSSGGGVPEGFMPLEQLRERTASVSEAWRASLEDCSVRLTVGIFAKIGDDSCAGRPRMVAEGTGEKIAH